VRDVAPKKVMICLSFVLPTVVAQAEPLTEFGAFSFLTKKRTADNITASADTDEQDAKKK
jgi:hypothetical protein